MVFQPWSNIALSFLGLDVLPGFPRLPTSLWSNIVAPTSLAQVMPHAMLRVRVQYQLLELVIIPCMATLQVAEDELSLVLVALIAGTRPVISLAMLR